PKGAVARLEPLPTFEEGGDVFFDLLRKECTSCHLWTQPKALKGNMRATGCAACHMPYAEDGRYQGGDVAVSRAKQGRPMRHVLTRQVPITQCATCHNGGSRAAMNFRGMMEAPPEGKQTFVYDQDLLHGHAYSEQTPDVHFTKGMVCIDCHTEREVHGDGQIYAKRHYEIELRCETCHGTPEKLGTGVTAQGRKLRNLFLPSGPNPTGLVTLVSKLSAKVHTIPQLATLPAALHLYQPGGQNRVRVQEIRVRPQPDRAAHGGQGLADVRVVPRQPARARPRHVHEQGAPQARGVQTAGQLPVGSHRGRGRRAGAGDDGGRRPPAQPRRDGAHSERAVQAAWAER